MVPGVSLALVVDEADVGGVAEHPVDARYLQGLFRRLLGRVRPQTAFREGDGEFADAVLAGAVGLECPPDVRRPLLVHDDGGLLLAVLLDADVQVAVHHRSHDQPSLGLIGTWARSNSRRRRTQQ